MSYEQYRANKIESGQLYQDFVVDLLFQSLGLAVVQYTSRFYQMQVGESRTGVEIKHDEKYVKTGNLWIEVSEKARPRAGDYAPSGVNRGDNTWLYVIGDYDTVFGFPKRFLKGLADSGRYRLIENNTKTSVGFLLPDKDARRFAAFILTPNCDQRITKSIQDLHEFGRTLHQLVLADTVQTSLF